LFEEGLPCLVACRCCTNQSPLPASTNTKGFHKNIAHKRIITGSTLYTVAWFLGACSSILLSNVSISKITFEEIKNNHYK
jgi:hypothetical protein